MGGSGSAVQGKLRPRRRGTTITASLPLLALAIWTGFCAGAQFYGLFVFILSKGIETLKNEVRHKPTGFELLPSKFTLLELQLLYETLLGYKFDKSNFRKKILEMNILKPLNEVKENVSHRPAKLFKFDEKRYRVLEKEGFSFEL